MQIYEFCRREMVQTPQYSGAQVNNSEGYGGNRRGTLDVGAVGGGHALRTDKSVGGRNAHAPDLEVVALVEVLGL